MSHQLPIISDPFEFARSAQKRSGEVEAVALARLASVLHDGGAGQVVHYQLAGYMENGKHFLDVEVTGQLVLTCQRCLSELPQTVESYSRLMLVRKEDPLPDEGLEEDDFDPVHAWRDFDVLVAVEEELLLALPWAPMHDTCSVPQAGQGNDGSLPFAALKNLKVSRSGKPE